MVVLEIIFRAFRGDFNLNDVANKYNVNKNSSDVVPYHHNSE